MTKRFIHIGVDENKTLALPLTQESAVALAQRGIVYDCTAQHDLHLTPDYEWDVPDVEALLIAVHEGQARVDATGGPFAFTVSGTLDEAGRRDIEAAHAVLVKHGVKIRSMGPAV